MNSHTECSAPRKIYDGVDCTIFWTVWEDGTRRVSGKAFEKDGRRAFLSLNPGFVPYGRDNATLIRYNEDGSERSASSFKDTYNAEQKAVKWALEGKC